MGDIELPFPAKILWPNGRGHHMAKHREFRAHKRWAYLAMVAEFHEEARFGRTFKVPERIDWSVTFYPKTRHTIDDDNARASLKAYQDGFALALGVNDSIFNAPKINFAEPEKPGKIVVRIEG